VTTPAQDVPTAFNLSADGHAIDFANTADWHAAAEPIELLTSYERLVAWARAVGVLDAPAAEALLAAAAQRPDEAESTLTATLELREAIFRIFSAVAHGGQATEVDLATLNAALPGALARLRLSQAPHPRGYSWTWHADAKDLGWFLAPVVRAAAELLVSPDVARLRECAGHPCGWIFLDLTKNGSRRWCEMQVCGTRAKIRRYRDRQRKMNHRATETRIRHREKNEADQKT
jgi:predicted RNA-binding Zn ribbon-like protein